MIAKPNYFKIGIYVIVSLTLLIAAITILTAKTLVKDVIWIETYVDQSVQGLSIGSPVMQRGVQIGRVERITFVNQEYHVGELKEFADKPDSLNKTLAYSKYVMLIMSVDKSNFPDLKDDEKLLKNLINQLIKKGFRLKVTYQGITGIAYVESDYVDPERFPPMEIDWTPRTIYVPWAPGTLANFKQSADRIIQKLEKVNFDKISLQMETLLTTVDTAIKDAKVAEVQTQLTGLLSELRTTNQKLLVLMDQENPDMTTIPQVVEQLNKTMLTLDGFISHQQSDVEEIIENVRRVSVNLREFSEYAKKYPSQIIFGSPPPQSELVK